MGMNRIFDAPAQFIPPLGMWRVVDTDGHPDNKRLRQVVGDYDNPWAAFDVLDYVPYPYTRSVYNDMGQRMMSITPGSESVPEAGSES